ncbi:MAG: MlaE family lipid ABC transporter permease subunit [Methylobacteriaceae bacterium]|nr:MlaE family lipid ABC transporter permease subunit [Methylobacteriaceae bacterium]
MPRQIDTPGFAAKEEVESLQTKDAHDENAPGCERSSADGSTRLKFSGFLTSEYGDEAEEVVNQQIRPASGGARTGECVIDLSDLKRMDTLGAWLVQKLAREAGKSGLAVRIDGASEAQRILLDETRARSDEDALRRPSGLLVVLREFVEEVGRAVVDVRDDLVKGIAFIGEITMSFWRGLRRRRGLRFPSIVNQMQVVAWRGVPIISLICFVVGGIIAQQGIFQLSYFGATPFAVDLIGILTCRELAVLLTAIMVAGRSGSAFTAEIGAMKMNEEIDALKVMGMDPINVLILPRLIALIVAMPMLTFIAEMAAFLGGGLVCWVYGDISPDIFLSRLRPSIGMNTFLVGMIKAPFMAFVIGIIATMEGMAVEGSSESLGVHVTQSVVKSIFMVIVMDGLFAVFFAAINY